MNPRKLAPPTSSKTNSEPKKRTVSVSAYIYLGYVATTGFLYSGNPNCWVVGFGIYSPGDKIVVCQLLKQTNINVYDPQYCNQIYVDKKLQPYYPITRQNICAGPTQLLAVCITLLCNESLAFFDRK